jgi:hypothetical protein
MDGVKLDDCYKDRELRVTAAKKSLKSNTVLHTNTGTGTGADANVVGGQPSAPRTVYVCNMGQLNESGLTSIFAFVGLTPSLINIVRDHKAK